jgi:hypothetical protein
MRHKTLERKLIYREHFFSLFVMSLELTKVIAYWIA